MLRDNLPSTQYMAGFFDGEGSIGIYRGSSHKSRSYKNTNYYLRTQLTQNVGLYSELLLNHFVNRFGGNLTKQISLSGKIKFNWQLNGEKANLFLKEILPFLQLKNEQAIIAIQWFQMKPKPSRDQFGRIKKFDESFQIFAAKVSQLMKFLKHDHIDQVMREQENLVEIVYELKQIMCIKG